MPALGVGATGAAAGAATTAATAATGAGVSAAGIQAGATLAGTLLAGYGTVTQMSAASDQAEASKRAEDLRKKQMEFNAQREKRQAFREAQGARAVALSNTAAAGAEDSSALPGAYGQIAGQYGTRVSGINENLSIGRGLFEAKAAESEAKGQIAFGSGMSSFGKDLIGVSPELGRIGSSLFG